MDQYKPKKMNKITSGILATILASCMATACTPMTPSVRDAGSDNELVATQQAMIEELLEMNKALIEQNKNGGSSDSYGSGATTGNEFSTSSDLYNGIENGCVAYTIPQFRLDGIDGDDYDSFRDSMRNLFGLRTNDDLDRVILDIESGKETGKYMVRGLTNGNENPITPKEVSLNQMLDYLKMVPELGKQIRWYSPQCMNENMAEQGHDFTGLADLIRQSSAASGYSTDDLRKMYDGSKVVTIAPDPFSDADTDSAVISFVPKKYEADVTQIRITDTYGKPDDKLAKRIMDYIGTGY